MSMFAVAIIILGNASLLCASHVQGRVEPGSRAFIYHRVCQIRHGHNSAGIVCGQYAAPDYAAYETLKKEVLAAGKQDIIFRELPSTCVQRFTKLCGVSLGISISTMTGLLWGGIIACPPALAAIGLHGAGAITYSCCVKCGPYRFAGTAQALERVAAEYARANNLPMPGTPGIAIIDVNAPPPVQRPPTYNDAVQAPPPVAQSMGQDRPLVGRRTPPPDYGALFTGDAR